MREVDFATYMYVTGQLLSSKKAINNNKGNGHVEWLDHNNKNRVLASREKKDGRFVNLIDEETLRNYRR